MSNASHKTERLQHRLRALAARRDAHLKEFPVIASSLHTERVWLSFDKEATFCPRLIRVGMEGFRTTRNSTTGCRFVVVRIQTGRSGLPKVAYVCTLGTRGSYHQITWKEKQQAWVDSNSSKHAVRLHVFDRTQQESAHPSLEGRRGMREAANAQGGVFLREHFTIERVLEADTVTGAAERIAVIYDPEDRTEEPETEELALDKRTNLWLGHLNAVYTILT